LREKAMSVIMSVMKTKTLSKKKTAARTTVLPRVFTVRDMNRNTALVLAACRQYGRVIVKHRAGEQFEVTPVPVSAGQTDSPHTEEVFREAMERQRQYRERIRAMGMRGPQTPEQSERVDMIIAGEI
jgi:hypothetical protein